MVASLESDGDMFSEKMRRLTPYQVARRLTKLVQALQSLPVSWMTTPGAMVIKRVRSHATLSR